MCVPEENTKRAYCNWFRVFNAFCLWATKRRLIIPSRHAAQQQRPLSASWPGHISHQMKANVKQILSNKVLLKFLAAQRKLKLCSL